MREGGTKQNLLMFSAYISKETIYQTKALAYWKKLLSLIRNSEEPTLRFLQTLTSCLYMPLLL